ncbi:YbaY family lipoprotein [Marilutibacter aestuarii]|uniref:Lipoprotein n=1 Tax=Marilutibacter aestuarii TaxID=1706195 RepID=A0A508A935_9GAMM|nr:YbaY family lipoprotein [Lysobacter aestuarii]TQD44408.1 hypothetical protein FKV25_09490 [Lysobacter aestuarii]
MQLVPRSFRPHALPASLLGGLVLALSACQPTPPAPATAAGDAAATPAEAAPAPADAMIEGRATYRERMLLPPGSRLSVQLLDNQLADTPRAVLAEVEVEDARSSPIPFRLPYDATELRPNGLYGLHASVRGPDGRLLFVTDTRHAVDPASDAPIELLMKRVAGRAAPDTPGEVPQAGLTLQCGDLRVDAQLRPGDGKAMLALSGRQLVLASADDGNRYEDDLGNALDTRDGAYALSLAGQPAVACTPVETPSPWGAAARRGIAFRAAGNEPGWHVEVGTGDAPRLKAELDYGTRTVEVERAAAQGLGYAGTATDGSVVRLEVERTACQDDMSGESFEASARLHVNGETFRGCGSFPAP